MNQRGFAGVALYWFAELVLGLAHVFLWFSGILGLYCLYLFGAQVLEWMRDGIWIRLPATSLFLGAESFTEAEWLYIFPMRGDRDLGAFSSWLSHPESWLGIHRLVFGTLEFFSTPVVLACIALCIALVSFGIIGKADQPIQKRP